MNLVNGEYSDYISSSDRGLQFGDGLFETMSFYDGEIHLYNYHIERLMDGCRRLGITPPDEKLIENELLELIADRADGVIKLIVTRGDTDRGYRYVDDIVANRVIRILPMPHNLSALRNNGVRMRVCETRLAINPALAGLKHLNRLEQVLARQEWKDDAIFDGIMLDTNGNVVEGVVSNIFIVKNESLITPPLIECGVVGTMRRKVMEVAAEQSISCVEKTLTLDDVSAADEMYITNSLIGMIPVNSIDDIKEFSANRNLYSRLATHVNKTL